MGTSSSTCITVFLISYHSTRFNFLKFNLNTFKFEFVTLIKDFATTRENNWPYIFDITTDFNFTAGSVLANDVKFHFLTIIATWKLVVNL